MLTIEYEWTQKVGGTFPSQGESLAQATRQIEVGIAELTGSVWTWEQTKYNNDTTTRPEAGEGFSLEFESAEKYRVRGTCGSMTGKYLLGKSFITLHPNRNFFSNCYKDSNMKLFMGELERARHVAIEEGKLQISLAAGDGIITFTR